MKTSRLELIALLTFIICLIAPADAAALGFRRIDTGDGLANSQVNVIFKDRQGFMWFGTGMGLARFDGFRFRNFFHNSSDSTTLRSNIVYDIVQPADGLMWVRTDEGWCIYDAATESFEQKPERWMHRHGMNGGVELAATDQRGNLLLTSWGNGLYIYNPRTKTARLMPYGQGRGRLPLGTVSSIDWRGQSLVLTYADGLMARIDQQRLRVVWLNDTPRRTLGGTEGFYSYIDRSYNYYVYTNDHTLVYSSRRRRWHNSLTDFLRAEGVSCPDLKVLVKDMQQDDRGNLWIATDHNGLLRVNLAARSFMRYVYSAAEPSSLPDNTLQCVLYDGNGGIWAGTLRNGAAWWSEQQMRFSTLPLGDICTMTEDLTGRVWMGSNDSGIICYDPATMTTTRYGMGQTGLGTDVVVSSLCQRDGTLWFGSFNGGLTRYRDGRFTAFRAKPGGLAANSVWTLAEDRRGNVIIGTLGQGLQLLDPKTMKFTTVDARDSRLTSDFISSVFTCPDGRILAGHSQNFSFVDFGRRKVVNIGETHGGQHFASRAVNQIIMDSRGLIWCANMSGLNVYDPHTDRLYTLTDKSEQACSVAEDRRGEVWVALSHGVTRFSVSRSGREWQFFGTTFDEMDGLQSRRLNYRSILATRSGKILVGGQDGVSVINTATAAQPVARARALFSGLVLFDRPLSVGEEYNGRVVLTEAVNSSRSLSLDYSENAFTLLLASDHVSVPEKSRFLYRLEGFNDDRWLLTAEGQPQVTYTNLSPGHYILQVRVVNRDGSVSPDVQQLDIRIEPPFWLTGWAYTLYVLAAVGLVWAAWHLTLRRKIEQMKIRQIQQEAERNRQLDEMKLTFFASVSHELRTPLTLIISPIKALMKDETEPGRRAMLSMILKSANRLLDLVNQTLDLRRIDRQKASLNLANGDVVSLTRELCEAFNTLSGRKVPVLFHTNVDSLVMSFDDDKLEKIITNLLSNALKFTPDGGHVVVNLTVVGRAEIKDEKLRIKPLRFKEADNPSSTISGNQSPSPVGEGRGEASGCRVSGVGALLLTVSDTGCGISDADKEHIFDRFYQARTAGTGVGGGSGIGLNLVREFTQMHGGEVSVGDNPGGGTVFTVRLPIRHDPQLPDIETDRLRRHAQQMAELSQPYAGGPRQDSDDMAVGTMNTLLKKGQYEVLLVDDNEDFLEFMTSQLKDTYRVRTATNGRDALRKIQQHRPDIILSDVMMPEMDGNELCRQLKANPKTERIPFVMLTARLSTAYKIEGMTNGADDYITKPFNLDLLNLRIANLIKWRNATPVGERIDPKITPTEITSVDEQLVRQATEYVERRLTDTDLSVEAMAEALSMSRVHMYKRLLAITGSTPSEFIRTIRLRHAARLLSEGKLNVSEVAYKVGFNNPRYFSKYFKEMYGVMPSQYKS